jgi:hypothetical protein
MAICDREPKVAREKGTECDVEKTKKMDQINRMAASAVSRPVDSAHYLKVNIYI